jgi:predicted DNA-binding transcriptional regulator AlpA
MVGKRNKKQHIQASSVSWIEQLAQKINVPFPPKGEGWITIKQAMEALGVSEATCKRILKKNNASRKKFRSILECGRNMVVWYYKI